MLDSKLFSVFIYLCMLKVLITDMVFLLKLEFIICVLWRYLSKNSYVLCIALLCPQLQFVQHFSVYSPLV